METVNNTWTESMMTALTTTQEISPHLELHNGRHELQNQNWLVRSDGTCKNVLNSPGVILKNYSVSFLFIHLFGNYYLTLWIVFHADFNISGRQPDSGPKPRTGRPSRGQTRPTTQLKCGLNKLAQGQSKNGPLGTKCKPYSRFQINLQMKGNLSLEFKHKIHEVFI